MIQVLNAAVLAGGGGGGATIKTFTTDHNKCGGSDTTDYLYTISGTYSWARSVGNGGLVNLTGGVPYDFVVCSDAGGTTKIPFHRVVHDVATGFVLYRAKVALLTFATDKPVYVKVGDVTVTTDQQNKNGTYRADYQAFFDMGDGTTLDLTDATANARNGTNHGGTAAAGPLAGALSLTPNNYVDMAVASVLTADLPTTILLAVNLGSLAAAQSLWGTANGSADLQFYVDVTGKLGVDKSLVSSPGLATTVLPTGAWKWVGITYDGTTLKYYLSGVNDGNRAWSVTFNPGNNPAMGVYSGVFYWLTGKLAAVRRLNTIMSADEMLQTFNNESSPSTFYTVT